MISITNLSFHFGARAMYDEASLHIKPGDKIGLIGANGTGKSTLLRIITGEYQPDGGSISMAKDCSIGFLNQDLLSYQTEDSILHVVMQAFQRALDVHDEMERVLHEMETNYRDELVAELGELQEVLTVLHALDWVGRLTEQNDRAQARQVLLIDLAQASVGPLADRLLVLRGSTADPLWVQTGLDQIRVAQLLPPTAVP